MSQSIYSRITETLLSMIRSNPGKCQRPWTNLGSKLPVNVASNNHYRGTNTLTLLVFAQFSGYTHNLWGTYRQWAALGAQVRKGEKGAPVIFFARRQVETDSDTEAGDDSPTTQAFARGSTVFNVSQVDGYEIPEQGSLTDYFDPDLAADGFVKNTGAYIEHGGDTACYIPSADMIRMPNRHQFRSAHDYYSTLLHELTHWTGSKDRLDRDLTGRFGTRSYAAEELVAELGAAFLGAQLGIEDHPRDDHAQYLASWVKLMEDDEKAIFTAAAAAQKATDYLLEIGKAEAKQAA